MKSYLIIKTSQKRGNTKNLADGVSGEIQLFSSQEQNFTKVSSTCWFKHCLPRLLFLMKEMSVSSASLTLHLPQAGDAQFIAYPYRCI